MITRPISRLAIYQNFTPIMNGFLQNYRFYTSIALDFIPTLIDNPSILLSNVLKKRRKRMRAHKHKKLLRRRRHKSIHNKNK